MEVTKNPFIQQEHEILRRIEQSEGISEDNLKELREVQDKSKQWLKDRLDHITTEIVKVETFVDDNRNNINLPRFKKLYDGFKSARRKATKLAKECSQIQKDMRELRERNRLK